jgi:AraC-like DNA-binding protein
MSRIVLEGQRRASYYKEMSNSLLLECIFLMSRMSHRASVSIFETSFRDRPEPEKHTADLLDLVNGYIAKNLHVKITPADMAAACGYNQDYLYRFIRKKTGVSAVRYINQKKFDRAKELIIHTELSLSEISWNLGFETLQYFSRFFKDHAGIPPSEYSRKVRATVRTDYPEDL